MYVKVKATRDDFVGRLTPDQILAQARFHAQHIGSVAPDTAAQFILELINLNEYATSKDPAILEAYALSRELAGKVVLKHEHKSVDPIIIATAMNNLVHILDNAFTRQTGPLPEGIFESNVLHEIIDVFSEAVYKMYSEVNLGSYTPLRQVNPGQAKPDKIEVGTFYGNAAHRSEWGYRNTGRDREDIDLNYKSNEYEQILHYLIGERLENIAVGAYVDRDLQPDNRLYALARFIPISIIDKLTATINLLGTMRYAVDRGARYGYVLARYILIPLFDIKPDSQRSWKEASTVYFYDVKKDVYSPKCRTQGKFLLSSVHKGKKMMLDHVKAEAGNAAAFLTIPLFVDGVFLSATLVSMPKPVVLDADFKLVMRRIGAFRQQFLTVIHDRVLAYKMRQGMRASTMQAMRDTQNIASIMRDAAQAQERKARHDLRDLVIVRSINRMNAFLAVIGDRATLPTTADELTVLIESVALLAEELKIQIEQSDVKDFDALISLFRGDTRFSKPHAKSDFFNEWHAMWKMQSSENKQRLKIIMHEPTTPVLLGGMPAEFLRRYLLQNIFSNVIQAQATVLDISLTPMVFPDGQQGHRIVFKDNGRGMMNRPVVVKPRIDDPKNLDGFLLDHVDPEFLSLFCKPSETTYMELADSIEVLQEFITTQTHADSGLVQRWVIDRALPFQEAIKFGASSKKQVGVAGDIDDLGPHGEGVQSIYEVIHAAQGTLSYFSPCDDQGNSLGGTTVTLELRAYDEVRAQRDDALILTMAANLNLAPIPPELVNAPVVIVEDDPYWHMQYKVLLHGFSNISITTTLFEAEAHITMATRLIIADNMLDVGASGLALVAKYGSRLPVIVSTTTVRDCVDRAPLAYVVMDKQQAMQNLRLTVIQALQDRAYLK